jgi:hypothetical protein
VRVSPTTTAVLRNQRNQLSLLARRHKRLRKMLSPLGLHAMSAARHQHFTFNVEILPLIKQMGSSRSRCGLYDPSASNVECVGKLVHQGILPFSI